MKALVGFVVVVGAFWGVCVFAVGFQRFLEWRENRRWEREVFEPSFVRMVAALERIQETA